METIDFKLENDNSLKFEITNVGRENVAFSKRSIADVCNLIEDVCKTLSKPLENISASKASIKFGVELSIESGSLTAIIVKGNTKANLEICLEWSK